MPRLTTVGDVRGSKLIFVFFFEADLRLDDDKIVFCTSLSRDEGYLLYSWQHSDLFDPMRIHLLFLAAYHFDLRRGHSGGTKGEDTPIILLVLCYTILN